MSCDVYIIIITKTINGNNCQKRFKILSLFYNVFLETLSSSIFLLFFLLRMPFDLKITVKVVCVKDVSTNKDCTCFFSFNLKLLYFGQLCNLYKTSPKMLFQVTSIKEMNFHICCRTQISFCFNVAKKHCGIKINILYRNFKTGQVRDPYEKRDENQEFFHFNVYVCCCSRI